MKNTLRIIAAATVLTASFIPALSPSSEACTRVIYHGTDSLCIVGRSLDWKTPIPTNVYVYPAGMAKKGSDKPGAVTWTSRYGAVYAVSYDGGVTEGMNEKGLSINGLFCKGTVYDNAETIDRPPMSLAMFVAWLLDMNATTDEVVDVLRRHNFSLSGATFDEGTVSALHWGITDASGKSAVVEFNNGDINIYVDTPEKRINAMTNDPSWPQMEAIVNYWNKIGGKNMLPGTVSSPDRCVRANYFVTHVQKTGEADLGAAITRTVLFNSCVPFSYTLDDPNEPNVSSTQWRSLSNLRDLRYYFDVATADGIWYVDLNKLDLKPGAPVIKYTVQDLALVAGDATALGKPSAPFTPMY